MGRRPAALLPIWLPARTMSAPKIRENRKTAAVCVPAEREAPNPAAQPSKERAADRDRASLAEILWELSLSALAGEEDSKSLSTPKRNKMPKLKRVVKPGGIKSFTKEPAAWKAGNQAAGNRDNPHGREGDFYFGGSVGKGSNEGIDGKGQRNRSGFQTDTKNGQDTASF